MLNVGRACQLAHSLYLHRNPANWQINDAEKSLRINLFWTVLIHVYWSSLTHGSPPILHENNFDVPVPTEAGLGSSSFIFVNLCSLTKVLGSLLPLIYTLQPKYAETEKELRRIESLMDDLETRLSLSLTSEQLHSTGANGESNLILCLLTLRLVLNRVAFKVRHT